MLPEGFVYLETIDASIKYDIRYATTNNFVGRKIDGYEKNVCIVSQPLGQALHNIQTELKDQGLEIFVFDTYRPQHASDDLHQWGLDEMDQLNKASYYPNINKSDFSSLGYINLLSSHTRGAAVDLTIIDRITGNVLDLGTQFDFMDPLSHPDNTSISELAFKHRQFLLKIMCKHGFQGLATEWWHFKLIDESSPEKYFYFVVE